MPDPKLVKRALAEISKRSANYEYFFDQLTSPDWIEPLRAERFFSSPPPPRKEDQWISFPLWPESRYLARVADQASDLVLEVILSIPETDNTRVHEDFAEAASRMPVGAAARLAQHEAAWVAKQPFLFGLHPHKLAEVIRHLANQDEIIVALELIATLLKIEPADTSDEGVASALRDPTAKMRAWDYGEVLRIIVPALFPKSGLKGLEVLANLLETVTPRSIGDRPHDHSYVWRPAIEDHDQNFNRDSLRDYLLVALRDAALLLTSSDVSLLPQVVEFLESREWHVFRRLALHVLRESKEHGLGLVAERLLMPVNVSEVGTHHEFWLLARDSIEHLDIEQHARVFELIRRGPDVEALQASRRQGDTNEMSAEEVDEYVKHWKLTRLTLLKGKLPPDLESLRKDLLSEFAEPEHPDLLMYMSSGFYGPRSPVNAEKFAQMPLQAQIQFLRTWEPSGERMGPSREGLGRILSDLIFQDPEAYAEAAEQFMGLQPTYVRSLLSALRDVLRAERGFSWGAVLKLCSWIVVQPVDSGEESNAEEDVGWKWSRKAIADLLSEGLSSGEQEIPFDLREQVWGILEPLTSDEDPTTEHEAKYGGSNMDPPTLSLNTIRGEAMHALIKYGLWVRRNGPDSEAPSSFDKRPEVREVLEAHLDPDRDPSLAIRAVYGQWFPWIALLDRQWAESQVTAIFPAEEALSEFRDAAWDTYVVFCSPFDTCLELLEGEYLKAIDRIGLRGDRQRRLEDPDQGLAHHLMTYYWRGKLDLEDPEGLLHRFFSKAPGQLRGDAIDFIGRSLDNTPGPGEPDVLERLERLWEWRSGLINKTNTSDYEDELGAFAWWFHSGKFKDEWAVANLKDVLAFRPKVEGAHLVAQSLITLADSRPGDAIELLTLLVRTSHKDWGILGWKDEARSVIQTVLATDEASTKEAAVQLLHELGSRGHREFRDLLEALA